ncbi:hypothetical protein SAMN05192588_2144 [Nonlabens sp. Hel1_33_55]|uniref:hypothetical protein n=1 Tax=Nonlabens sp. Hel1_33_55 TaxID=1336802 RepID=UPI000875DFDF|nr:hypothetical protein [Nonlabens sp. Hel1_33_55]SCY30264.1 hypothetical protein SAMN05192588_2144 [Nonlabens sp. Hel1_33_55]
MKNLLSLSFLILFASSHELIAQVFTKGQFPAGSRTNTIWHSGNNLGNSNSTLKEITEPENINGSPFLFQEAIKAQLIFNDPEEDAIELNLNYNAFADFMKIVDDTKANNAEIELLPRAWNFDVLMDGKRFRYINFTHNKEEINSYVEILESFENNSFLALRRSKEVSNPSSSRKSYTDVNNFYLINANGIAIKLENDDKRILNDIPQDKKSILSSFISDKNVEFDDTYRGVKGVARYYASLD